MSDGTEPFRAAHQRNTFATCIVLTDQFERRSKSVYKNYKRKKEQIGIWDVALGQNSQAGFVMGYYYNQDSGLYDVYLNNERGRQRIRLSTNDEVKALDKLLSMIEFEID